MHLAILAGGLTLAAASNTTQTEAQPLQSPQGAYRVISEIAGRTCLSPQGEGWAWNANGSAQAHIDVDRLKKLLGSGGLSLAAGGGYARWSGPLQRDVGAALSSRNDCAAKVFVAMVQNLPLQQAATGKPVAKPSQPMHAYQRLLVPPSNTITAGPGSNNSNGTGQQLTVGAPSTNLQVGGPTASGGGPAIQNNYFPPVTADQKQQAHDALLADLKELARYPERGAVEPGPSIVQHHFKFKVARALYLLLAKYNYPTISTVPGGEQLNRFERDYYEFEINARLLERVVIKAIGTEAPQKMAFMWNELYEYCLVRTFGYTPEQFAGANGQPNYGITPEQQEALYQKLRADPKLGPALQAQADAVNSLTDRAHGLLQPFQTD